MERELQKVLESYPRDEEVLNDLGGIRLELHRTPEARQSYEQLLAVNPSSAEAYLGLGAAAFQDGDMAQALKEYQQAEGLNGKLSGVYGGEGECLLRLKRYDEAIAAFQKEIEVGGDDAVTERGLSEAYKAKGMMAESDAALKRAETAKSAE